MSPDETPKKTVLAMKKVIWKVQDYSKTYFTMHEPGDLIKSNTFTVSKAGVETEWFLNLYPNGEEEESKAHVSLFLFSVSAEEVGCIDFNVKFRFGVVKKNHQFQYFESEWKQFKEELRDGGFGHDKFLSHAELFDEANGYVVDGTFTILVELIVEYEERNVKPQTSRVAAFTALSTKMKDDYKKIFENNALTDFRLNVSDGEVLKAHKIILAARSPVFFAMLTNDMKEMKDGSVDVPDIDSTVMKEVLRFIYYNEVEGLEEIAPMLIFAAEKYQLDELKAICLEKILAALEVQNVIESLKIAHQISCAHELFKVCLNFILNNYSEVRHGPSWNDLPNELVIKILDESCDRPMII